MAGTGKASRLMKGSLFAYRCKRQCGRYTANKGKVCTRCLNNPLFLGKGK